LSTLSLKTRYRLSASCLTQLKALQRGSRVTQRNSGHFLTKLPKSQRGYESTVKDGCCFDGNVLYYLNHFGYLDDQRTQKLLDFIYDYYDAQNAGWKCRAYPINPDRVLPVNCYMGAMKILKASSMIPEEKRSPQWRRSSKKKPRKYLKTGYTGTLETLMEPEKRKQAGNASGILSSTSQTY